jgi:Polyketide cyclase / dehydrase and lipid transport
MRTLQHNDRAVIRKGSALGIEVDKKIEAPGAPAQVWEVAVDFCAIKAWHPLVADCKQTNEGDTILRILTVAIASGKRSASTSLSSIQSSTATDQSQRRSSML